MKKTRVEHDSMGDVEVPADALYGAQTQRALVNFKISGETFAPSFLEALLLIKGAAAQANLEFKRLDPRMARAIIEAARSMPIHAFPLDIFQTGSGTSTNMNANEVIATLASRRLKKVVHPNDHVNLSQSSNDVMPSAAHLAALRQIRELLVPSLRYLHAGLTRKAMEFDRVVKPGRTHLMDAVPVRLGQEFSGYAAQVAKGIDRIEAAARDLEELAIGGTAVGTGMNAPKGFGKRVAQILSKETGLKLREASNHFEAQGSRDAMVHMSGALRTAAVSLMKIANDIRWMGGSAIGELKLPELQPGSSIMPGKVNPVMCEVMIQVGAQVIGNDAAIAIGGLSGNFELNVMIPVMTVNLLKSISLLGTATANFTLLCVEGLAQGTARPLEPAALLNPVIGYDRAAALAKEAAKRGISVKDLAIEKKLITKAQAQKLFDPRRMTEPS